MRDARNPRVSIIIPVFNGANFLAEAIDSALAQTYADVEVLVVNDGSRDGGRTAAIARRYGDRIVYLEQENRGVSGALNTGISRMTGEIFTWLSHDDIHLPEKVEAQVAYYNELRRPKAILFSNFFLINESGEIIEESKLPFEEYIKTPILPLLHSGINGCTLFIPVEILREFGPFDERLRYVQDYDLWNKILMQCEFLLQPRTLVKYRIHAGQDTNKPAVLMEADPLWIRIVESRSGIERVQLFGSTKRFYVEMAKILAGTPYKTAADQVRLRIESIVSETLVSVVLACFGDSVGLGVAVDSVLSQTHASLELLLVDRGFAADAAPLEALLGADTRVRVVRRHGSDENIARASGIRAARGEYIAFVSPGDAFLPGKIAAQLTALQDAGALVSHTFYTFAGPERLGESLTLGRASVGQFADYEPGVAPIAASTVMLHRILLSSKPAFVASLAEVGAVFDWSILAEGCSMLIIEEPLSTVRRVS